MAQKSGWAALEVGVYIFSRVVSSVSCHCSLMASAQPLISSKTLILSGLTRRLLITKATPADVWGESKSGDERMVRHWP